MFAGGVSRAKLEGLLAKSIGMAAMIIGEGFILSDGEFNEALNFIDRISQGLDPNLLVMGAAYQWDVFPSATDKNYADDERFFTTAKERADIVHQRKLYYILEGGIPETAYAAYAPETPQRVAQGFQGAGVDQIPIPAWVFQAFGETPVTRNFNYENMIYANGHDRNRWLPGASVPDISRPEAKKWYYYRACRYIDSGYEALNLAQIYLVTDNDRPNYTNTKQVLDMIRAYAATHARRHWVFISAITQGVTDSTNHLLFDYHTWPLRPKGVDGHPCQAILEAGYQDSIYGQSLGGISPSGWTCDHLPYAVHFDNIDGKNGDDHTINTITPYVWNWDEMAWFAHQPERYRNDWLWYASHWIRTHDPNGYITFLGRKICQDPVNFGTYGDYWWYKANTYRACNYGLNQEATIKAIWNSQCSGYHSANFNTDCKVDITDMAMFAQKWYNITNCSEHYALDPQDFNGDCKVDMKDLTTFAQGWLTSF
jgi:hypothetical protein